MSAHGTFECLFCDLKLPWDADDLDTVDRQMRDHLYAHHGREVAALREVLGPSPSEFFVETGEPT